MKNIKYIVFIISFLLLGLAPFLVRAQTTTDNNKLGWSVLPGSPFTGEESVNYIAALGGKIYFSSVLVSPNPSRSPATPANPFSNHPYIWQKMLTSFDPQTLEWKRVQEIPHDYTQAGDPVPIFTINDTLYSIVDHPRITKRFVRRYDFTSDQWVPTPIPTSSFAARNTQDRSREATVVVGTRIYFLGGDAYLGANKGYGRVANVTFYDTANDTWDVAPSLPFEYIGLAATTDGNNIFVLGNRQSSQPPEFIALRPGASEWETLSSNTLSELPLYFNQGSNDELYAVTSAGVQIYNISTDSWREGPQLPCPLTIVGVHTFSSGATTTYAYKNDFGGVSIRDKHFLFPRYWEKGSFIPDCSFFGQVGKVSLPSIVFTLGTDTDNDGILDDYEALIGTDPTKADTDNDGYWDSTELLQNYSPTIPAQKINNNIVSKYSGWFITTNGSRADMWWYVDPVTRRRYFVTEKFNLDVKLAFKTFGLGVKASDLNRIAVAGSPTSSNTTLARRLAGRILLNIEDRGHAWWVNPRTSKRHDLGGDNPLLALGPPVGYGLPLGDFNAIPVGSNAYFRFYPVVSSFLM